ncbi:MAG: hypothetical protein BWY69_00684 [Planctomycetes bacterium ADurb.Bin401]|nr:MAG: hypothetical protein BWY69_00684 [Planctomycetes bacterium ADurb.Bin401]
MFQKIIGKEHNIVFSFAQRREENRKNVNSVIKVFPEKFFFNLLLEIFISSDDDSHITLYCINASNTFELLELYNSKQFDLEIHREIANFVKKDRSAVGFFESANFAFSRARKSAFLMAEKLAFKQRFRQSGTVYFDKRLICSAAVVMYGVRNEVFACSAFASDQHCGVAVGNLLDEPVNLFHCIACADHIVNVEMRFKFLAKAEVFFRKPSAIRFDEFIEFDCLSY